MTPEDISRFREQNALRRALRDTLNLPRLCISGGRVTPCQPCGKPSGESVAVLTEHAPKRFGEWVVRSIQDDAVDVIDWLLEELEKKNL